LAVIERLARRRRARGQFHFASEAKALIPAREDFLLAKSNRGLHLLGRDEHSLRVPLGVLRAAYGLNVMIEPHAAGEPVMEVRIGVEQRHLAKVRSVLRRRGANPSEEYDGVHYCVLRFEAAPAELLGLPVELVELTSGRVNHQILLRRYQ
jgi:hypothetical protein